MTVFANRFNLMICCIFKKIAQNINHINIPKYNTAILIMAFFLLSAKALWRMRYIPLPASQARPAFA